MSFLYVQRTGQLFHNDIWIGTGAAGRYEGYNNPDMQNVPFIGPLPCGWYTIKASYLHATKGPITMDLDPHPDNEMFGRDLMRIHGFNADHPKTSSEGCICAERPVRVLISKAQQLGDDQLQVVADYPVAA